MAAHQHATTPLVSRWTDSPPFNNAANTVLTSIGLAGAVFSLLVVLRALLRDRHDLMYQDNGIAGLICCYPFRALDQRRRQKEAEAERGGLGTEEGGLGAWWRAAVAFGWGGIEGGGGNSCGGD